LNAIAAGELERILVTRESGSFSLSRELFAGLDLAISRRILRLAIGEVRGNLKGIEFRLVDRVIKAARAGDAFSITLPGSDVRIGVNGNAISIATVAPPRVPLEVCAELMI